MYKPLWDGPVKVENLDNFPFKSFNDLKASLEEGESAVVVNPDTAFQWSRGMPYASKSVQRQSRFFALLSYGGILVFLAHIVISGEWLLLLWLPFFLFLFFIFAPINISGWFSKLVTRGAFVLLIYSFLTEIDWLFMLCIGTLVVWLGHKGLYGRAVTNLSRALLEHEDLLSFVWQKEGISIWFKNGNKHWMSFKEEGGEVVVLKENI